MVEETNNNMALPPAGARGNYRQVSKNVKSSFPTGLQLDLADDKLGRLQRNRSLIARAQPN